MKAQTQIQTEVETAELPVSPSSMPKRVLIVDDNREIRSMLASFIGMLDCNVLQAGDGREALERLRQNPVDLVITDLDMPVMDGFTLLNEVKNIADWIPVVVITGCMDLLSDEHDSLASAAAIMLKPFNLMEIKKVIDGLP